MEVNENLALSAANYENHVGLKFQLYNSLFLTLPLDGIKNTGIFIPVLNEFCLAKLAEGHSPVQIIAQFFEEYKDGENRAEQINFLFKVIQYIERQVVLVDALEDAAYGKLNNLSGKGSLSEFMMRMERAGNLEDLMNRLQDFSIRPVLTAHPTQFYPGRVLAIITDLTAAIQENDLGAIRMYLKQLGKTPFFQKAKPTPYDEAINLIWYLQNVFYQSAGDITAAMRRSLPNWDGTLNLINLGFWPGGDRDGNPYVSVDTTLQVANRLRDVLLQCYYQDLRNLRRRISFSGVYEDLMAIEKMVLRCIRHQDEWDFKMFRSSLHKVLNDLHEHHDSIFVELVEELLDRVALFGSHFASIDLRQDSREIKRAFDAVADQLGLEVPSTPEELFALDAYWDGTLTGDDRVDDTLQSFRVIREIQAKNGPKGAHRYIISNCRGAMDVARVFALARWTAFGDEKISVDIVPLFETIDDLVGAGASMNTLYSESNYRRHLTQRGNKQTIMLGFSDGTKDGGYMSANWNIYRAKENLTRISKLNDIDVVFFDGRGGPPARGGGNTHNFYASLGQHIASSEIQLTVQGQTISSNFGTSESAQFNMEQLITAGLENLLLDDDSKILQPNERQLLEELSDISLKYYSALKEDPLFTEFLEEMSPLKYYGQANIGSRPSKRGQAKKLELDDLRAIPFVGAWSQLKMNIPGFYGLGKALQEISESGRLHEVQALYRQSKFFRTLVENSMQSMCKTFFPLTAYMASDIKFGAFWSSLNEEFERTQQWVLKISGQAELLSNNPGIKASIALRENIVLPLLVIQQYALITLREQSLSEADRAIFEKMVVRSLYGNINASRNSA
ncbi:MAG: phosphoenolpyruvate carboxylase [Schleiferiaceae bacterium]|jgi:phosphoenolpyruvate carboxylase|nr:phosphoenolpyruvate carboxylase [Schleiferiaceae bacterium]MDP4758842.1 phosphoenolpyruvate carboxylase [Schleiferiaceae bacterium]MDP4877972.1 phosphoenolpyruvate carboxylase [Schleiferiaceae bacterium]MDP4959420.1 phosphoenolpyruvate carboxylase [Schleiferiaceae bacterium]